MHPRHAAIVNGRFCHLFRGGYTACVDETNALTRVWGADLCPLFPEVDFTPAPLRETAGSAPWSVILSPGTARIWPSRSKARFIAKQSRHQIVDFVHAVVVSRRVGSRSFL